MRIRKVTALANKETGPLHREQIYSNDNINVLSTKTEKEKPEDKY